MKNTYISLFLIILLNVYVVAQCDPNAGFDATTCGPSYQLGGSLGDPGSTGTWSTNEPGAVFSDIHDPNSTITFPAAPINPVEFYWTEDNTIIPCTDVDTVIITFVTIPSPDAGNDMIVCGDFAQLNATISNSSNVGYWSCSNSGVSFSDPMIPNAVAIYSTAPDTKTTETLIFTETAGCATNTDSLLVTFVGLPSADFSAMATCEDDYSLTTYIGNAGTSATYSWTFNGGLPTSATSIGPHNIFYDNAGTFQVLLVVTDTNACSNTSTQDVIVVPYGSPNCCMLPMSNAGLDDTICGTTNQLQAVPSYGFGTWSLVAGPGSANFADLNDPNTDVVVSAYGDYEFMWLENNGIACHDSDNVSITFFGGSTVLGNILFNSTILGTGDAEVEIYKLNSGSFNLYDMSNIATNNTYSIVIDDPGDYIIKADILNQLAYPDAMNSYYNGALTWDNAQVLTLGCNNTYTIDVDIIQTTPFTPLNGKVSGTITYEGSGAPVTDAVFFIEDTLINHPYLFAQASSSGYYEFDDLPLGDYRIIVDLPGIPQVTMHNFSVTAVDTLFENYDFYVDTTISKQAGLGIYADSSGFLGVNRIESSINSQIKVYPNPFKQDFNLKYNVEEDCEVEIQIIDATGRVQQYSRKNVITGDNIERITLEEAGVYIVILKMKNEVYIKKLISK